MRKYYVGYIHPESGATIIDGPHSSEPTKYTIKCRCGETWIQRVDVFKKSKKGCKQCANKALRIGGDNHVINNKWKSLLGNAKSRNLDVSITKDDFIRLVKKNCIFCGARPSETDSYDRPEWATVAFTNGVDRYNNNLGYTLENSVPCCKRCNAAKSDMSIGDFLSLIERIYNRKDIWVQV